MTALISSQAGQITRRGIFIGAAASLLCAPAIVRATSLMPVRRLRVRIAPQYAGFCERLMYQSLDSSLRADKMSTVLNGKIIPEDNARRMVAYARVQGWLRPMDCAGTRFMHSLTDLNFHSDDESSRYSDKPLPVDWKVYDVLLYDFRTQPGQNAWRRCSCRCPTAISIRRKAASHGARCEITDIASCSRHRPAGRHVRIRKW